MVKDLWGRLWAPKNPAPVDGEPLDSEPLDVSEEGPAERRGVSLPGVAVAVLVSIGAVLLAADLVGRTWRADLPPLFVLAGFPLVLGAASLLTSDVWRTREEKLDRWLGLSFRGDRRQAARAAYAKLWTATDEA